jgi:formate--tetrahydrofolate ligase
MNQAAAPALKPIADIASTLGIQPDDIEFFGHDKAKVRLQALDRAQEARPQGKLILVSAITPTPAGEGKTTTSIGIAQGMGRIGKNACLALRQPSMGPVFGRKGGATGGGASRVEPSDAINLQFTGDFHAVTSAHNLLAAVVDNRLHFGDTRLDARQVLWKRVMDMNDRALRRIVLGLGGPAQGVPREGGFDITAASEIMAILCLSESRQDLRARLERIVVGYTAKGREPVLAGEMGVIGSMAAILNEAILPNLVQSREGAPAFVHGGPFANIAHGCNSVLATRMALAHSDYAITEAGFAFDLGGEKFFDIKCRTAGLNPSAVVIVATVRALKMHGGTELDELAQPDASAVERGLENLAAHLDASKNFGKPVVVAINQRVEDTRDEVGVIHTYCEQRSVACSTANVFGEGGAGAIDLAEKVVAATATATPFAHLYPLETPLADKIETIAKRMYGAKGVVISTEAEAKLKKLTRLGYGGLPICMAKTQDSLTDNPKLRGRPRDFTISVRDIELAAGAGFVVALTGELVRMPGLPERPAAERIEVDEDGVIRGLT